MKYTAYKLYIIAVTIWFILSQWYPRTPFDRKIFWMISDVSTNGDTGYGYGVCV